MNVPKTIEEFTNLKPWWKTPVNTRVVLSQDGVTDILRMLGDEGRRPFFVADGALAGQREFARIFAERRLFVFDASASEPRTGDVDALRALIKALPEQPDTLVGVGGGATMDLAKATAICLANPEPAQFYQGYGLDMEKGADVWVLPTLTGTGAEITPIAVLRGPEKKLGINNKYAEAETAVIDPSLTRGAPAFNRFYTMMDCYFHHYEIMTSKTSAPEGIEDAPPRFRACEGGAELRPRAVQRRACGEIRRRVGARRQQLRLRPRRRGARDFIWPQQQRAAPAAQRRGNDFHVRLLKRSTPTDTATRRPSSPRTGARCRRRRTMA